MGDRMQRLFDELRERLLLAGVAPRHVRRYLGELADHLADLRAEEERPGRDPAEAEAAALGRLGGVDALSRAMIGQRRLQSWCARAPWAVFGLGAPLLLAVAYLVACLILWTGWGIFLPGSASPFVSLLDRRAVLYFGVGRLLYYSAPVLVGWGLGVLAIRQRLKSDWLILGLAVIALLGSAAQVHASSPASHGGAGRVSMGLAFGSSAQDAFQLLVRAAATFLLLMLPSLVWRLTRERRLPG